MDKYSCKSSGRRTFLKKAALTSVAWMPVFQAQRCLGDVANGTPATSPLWNREEIRIGLIGLTGHPGIVLNAIPHIRGARLVAFAAADADWLPKTPPRKHPQGLSDYGRLPSFHKDTRIYKTYQEMLANEELDIVASCLPNGLNVYASMAAARRGCHVIAEHPLAADSNCLTELEAVLHDANLHISTMCEMRACSGVATMRQAIAGGLIGEPIVAFAQKPCRPNEEQSLFQGQPEPCVGTPSWMGLDLLDCISYTTGQEITQASALQSNKGDAASGCQQNPGLLLKLLNGATGIVSVQCAGPQASAEGGSTRLRVTGTEAVMEMIRGQVKLLSTNHPPKEMPLLPSRSSFETFVTFLRGEGSHLISTGESFRVARAGLIVDRAVKERRLIDAA